MTIVPVPSLQVQRAGTGTGTGMDNLLRTSSLKMGLNFPRMRRKEPQVKWTRPHEHQRPPAGAVFGGREAEWVWQS
jgi:hypothetical protein